MLLSFAPATGADGCLAKNLQRILLNNLFPQCS